MPDTMIQTEATPINPVSIGIMDGYRSASIGKLVCARAKASKAIKSIIKDKTADIPNKNGGRGYQYAYADLATVLEAVEDAISEQGLAIFQTTQTRQNGTFLITTLAHESDQWVGSEIRLKSADAGPQVYGSEMTYLRRYAVLALLALAPEADDDGKAAQERADQQARQKPAQRVEPSRRPDHTQKHPGLTPPSRPEPQRMPFPADAEESQVKSWLHSIAADLQGRPEEWRRRWLELNQQELEELRAFNSDWANRVQASAIAPDMQGDAA